MVGWGVVVEWWGGVVGGVVGCGGVVDGWVGGGWVVERRWLGGGWDENWPKEELAKRGIGQKRTPEEPTEVLRADKETKSHLQ